jgi:aspartyl-tRNA(Asn)/glutamyl-tRNA(Gln) amidotransferase subunit B
MRTKESSEDYRYFPEPDLPPLHLDPAWLAALRAALPELPAARRARYAGELGLSPYDAAVITADEAMTAAFEAIRAAGPDLPAKEVANLVTGDYGRALKETAERTPAGLAGRADAGSLAHLLGEIVGGRLSRPNAKEVLVEHVATGTPAAAIIAARGFAQISDEGAIDRLVDEVLAANPAAVADYRAGKVQAVGFLVGQVMKASRGQANAGLAQAAVRARLDAGEGSDR